MLVLRAIIFTLILMGINMSNEQVVMKMRLRIHLE